MTRLGLSFVGGMILGLILVVIVMALSGCSVVSTPSITTVPYGGHTCIALDPPTAKNDNVAPGIYCPVSP